MASPEQENSKAFGRRVFLRRTGQVLAAATEAMVLGGQLPRLREFVPPSHAKIVFDPEQEQRLAREDSMCLLFGGATIKSIKPTTDVLLPVLEQLGPVSSIEYANHGLDVAAIAQNIRLLQQRYGIRKVSIYTHSLGAQVAGEVFEHLGDTIKLKHALLDCAVPSLDYVDHPNVAKAFSSVSALTGEIGTAVVNMAAHGRPYKWDLAPTGLLQEEMAALSHGERYLDVLAKKALHDTAHVVLLTPEDPEKDPIVDAIASKTRLQQLFPELEVVYLRGNQGHANPPVNQIEYRSAIAQSLRQYTRGSAS